MIQPHSWHDFTEQIIQIVAQQRREEDEANRQPNLYSEPFLFSMRTAPSLLLLQIAASVLLLFAQTLVSSIFFAASALIKKQLLSAQNSVKEYIFGSKTEYQEKQIEKLDSNKDHP